MKIALFFLLVAGLFFSVLFFPETAYACSRTNPDGSPADRERDFNTCNQYQCTSGFQPDGWFTALVTYTYTDNTTCTQTEFFTTNQCTANQTGSDPCPASCTSDSGCVSGAYCTGGIRNFNYCTQPRNGQNGTWCESWNCGASCDATQGCQPWPVCNTAPCPGTAPYSSVDSCNAAKAANGGLCPGTPTATPTPTPTPTPTTPPGVTPIATATPTPTSTPGPTPTPTPSCNCLSGAGSCGTNSRNLDGSMPASAWPPGCPVPACSGVWDYHSEDDATCQNSPGPGAGYWCWQCSVLPTPTPVPSGVPTPTPTPIPASCSWNEDSAGCDQQGEVGKCTYQRCIQAKKTCQADCQYNDASANLQSCTVRSQAEVTDCLKTTNPSPCGDSSGTNARINNIVWSSPAGSCPVAAPTAATYTISGIVFIDRNDNDRKEADEALYSGARLFLNTQTITTDANGSYQFTGVTSGSYTLELDVPFGFSPNKSTGYDTTTGANRVGRSVGPNATADFGIVPYEVGVGGTLYTTLDINCSAGITTVGRLGSKSLSLLDNYFGQTFTTATDLSGVYSFSAPNQTLFPGSYSITPSDVTGARLVCAVIDGTAYETVRATPYTYGDDPPGEDLTLTATNPQKRVDFYYLLVQPWFQGQGADMRIDAGFADPVSASSPNPYAMLSNGRSTGVIFSGGNRYSFCTAGAGTCLERASELANPWVSGGTTYPESFTSAMPGTTRTSYSYLLGLVQQNGQTVNEITNSDCYTAAGCDLAAFAPGVYTNQTGQGDVYTRNSKNQFNRGDYVFLINGNLHIQGELESVNNENASALVVSVSGDITVDKSVGGSSSSPSPHLEGLFSADSDFILESEGTEGDNCPSPRDKRLNIEGAVVANATLSGGTFQNKRTLCDDNSDYPVFYLEESPYLILNAPDYIKHKSFVWQEVAP